MGWWVGENQTRENSGTNSSALHKETAESTKNCCDRRRRRLATIHKRVSIHGTETQEATHRNQLQSSRDVRAPPVPETTETGY